MAELESSAATSPSYPSAHLLCYTSDVIKAWNKTSYVEKKMIHVPNDLQYVIEKLRMNANVEGALLIGSLAKQTFNPLSDYDIVLFLHGMPSLWYVGVTAINNRFTDIIFVSVELLQKTQDTSGIIPEAHELAPIIRWLKQGTILIDQNNKLHTAK